MDNATVSPSTAGRLIAVHAQQASDAGSMPRHRQHERAPRWALWAVLFAAMGGWLALAQLAPLVSR